MNAVRLHSLDLAFLQKEFDSVPMTMEIPIASWDWIEVSQTHEGKPQVRAFGSSTSGAQQFALEVRFAPVMNDGKPVPGKWTWQAEAEVRDDLGQPTSILRLSSDTDEVVEYMKVVQKD